MGYRLIPLKWVGIFVHTLAHLLHRRPFRLPVIARKAIRPQVFPLQIRSIGVQSKWHRSSWNFDLAKAIVKIHDCFLAFRANEPFADVIVHIAHHIPTPITRIKHTFCHTRSWFGHQTEVQAIIMTSMAKYRWIAHMMRVPRLLCIHTRHRRVVDIENYDHMIGVVRAVYRLLYIIDWWQCPFPLHRTPAIHPLTIAFVGRPLYPEHISCPCPVDR